MREANPTIRFIGKGLVRPECVIAHSSGLIIVPDWTDAGGVSVLFPDGRIQRHLAVNPPHELKPNGIALLPGGDVLLVHLGTDLGGVWRLHPDGNVRPELMEVEGAPLPPSNFCHVDHLDRRWLSVSTRTIPRANAYRADVCDGFIVLSDGRGDRIVADGLGYTNECLVHPDGERLFVNETFSKRLTCFDIAADGSLRNRRTVAEFGSGTYPDGMAFDSEGNVWIVSVVSNRVIQVDDKGEQRLILEDLDEDFVAIAESAYQKGELGRPHLDNNPSALANISSMAFCGEGMKTIVLGCLLGDRLPLVEAPVNGWEMPHYRHDITPLLTALARSPAS